MSTTEDALPAAQQPSFHPITASKVMPSTSTSQHEAAALMPAPVAKRTNTGGSGSSSGAYSALEAAGQQYDVAPSSNRSSHNHPPSKSATGGQSHSHRPVSAMPTPASHSSRAGSASASSDVFNYSNNNSNSSAAYADRRASAHPTLPVASQSVSGLPQLAMSPSIDPAIASSAISSGIPITSPAALAYFAAHPRRQQVHFGNYLLLQTLGEGEFGKVKLGVHKEWGEEVAVKLIKRDKVGAEHGQLNLGGGHKDSSKLTKVEREIQVLKDVRHPNIVRLYEVIESDRFIGIVLEYASGGELFDHILAHKYLKDRDACRLFAQLISGVNYLHSKKIVHRDLKLENLLLDRNRNVIITDFGFANDFGSRRDDLMATSCGSPCYAAPELVVQDGLYNGSAVDVWSCGVILYAMLAGYLPFDDDPANPEGDNINLLYKYIMATPLSFPDYIGAEPRDLLSKMLVPDPQRRIDLEGVMAHSWLAPYRELFRFTVDELERAAIEQQTRKRQAYRQQMALQQQMQEQQRRAALPQRNGVPSSSASVASGLAPQSVKAQRHQSATAVPSSASVTPVTRSAARASPSEAPSTPLKDNTNRVHDVAPETQMAAEEPVKRVPAGSKPQRHTVQLEYHDQQQATPQSNKKRSTPGGTVPSDLQQPQQPQQRSPGRPKVAKKISAPRMTASGSDLGKSPAEADEATEAAPPAVPAIPILVPQAEQVTTARVESKESFKQPEMSASKSQQDVEGGKSHRSRESTVTPETRPEASPRSASKTGAPAASEVSFPTSATESRLNGQADKSTASSKQQQPTSLPGSVSTSVISGADQFGSRQQPSSMDKSFLARLRGPSGAETGADRLPTAESQPAALASSAEQRQQQQQQQGLQRSDTVASSKGNRSGSARRKAMSLVVGHRADSSTGSGREGKDSAKAVKEERRLTGRLRLSSNASQKSRPTTATPQQMPSLPSGSSVAAGQAAKDRRSSQSAGAPSSRITRQQAAALPSTPSSGPQTRSQTRAQNDTLFDTEAGTTPAQSGPSSSAAKKVMDWFRKKSLARGSGVNPAPATSGSSAGERGQLLSPTVEVPVRRDSRRKTANAVEPGPGPETEREPAPAPAPTATSDQRRVASNASTAQTEAPRLVVTGSDNVVGAVSEGGPSSRSTSGAYSQGSHISGSTDNTGLTSATEASQYENRELTPSKPTTRSAAAAAAAAPATSNPSSTEMVPSESHQSQASLVTPRASSNPMHRGYDYDEASSPQLYNENAMRYHLGAVDQSALTSRSPPAVFAEVCRVLYEMGIEARKEREEEFKLECVRRKKVNKSLIASTQGIGLSLRTSVFPPTQADYERSAASIRSASGGSASGINATSTPGSVPMSSSPSSGMGMSASPSSLRNFLRRSSQASPLSTNVALPGSNADLGGAAEALSPPAIYGEPRVDGGQEVRFSVEITRIKNLPGLYSLDIRRLRGPLTSYKFLYHNVLTRTQLTAAAVTSDGSAGGRGRKD